MSLWKTLSTCPLFYDIHQDEMEAHFINCRVSEYHKGETIFSEADEVNYLFTVLEGQITVSKSYKKDSKDIQVLSQGSFYGEHFLFSDIKQTEVLTVQENTKVLEIPFTVLQNIFENEPLIYSIFITNLNYLVLKKFEITQNIVFRIMGEENNTIRTPLYDDQTIRKAYSREERDKFLKNITKT
ncbi:Crp/Fnr family transcriptional regulator [Bacteriovoracales bacterium]|nr:Crp/Fnr family transcriptional regulator [Bacteriovoracales bacterium]